MSAEPSALSTLFGSTKGMEDDDAPSDDDVKGAKSDAFNAFFDSIHSKDREGARKAVSTLMGDDEEEAEETKDDSSPDGAEAKGAG